MHGINIEGLLDVAAATAALAVKDLRSDNEQHRRSAWRFLDEAGLLERVHERMGVTSSLHPTAVENISPYIEGAHP